MAHRQPANEKGLHTFIVRGASLLKLVDKVTLPIGLKTGSGTKLNFSNSGFDDRFCVSCSNNRNNLNFRLIDSSHM